MNRAFYSTTVPNFCGQSPEEILGEITENNTFDLVTKQKNTWIAEIKLLQETLSPFINGSVALEFTVPRIGHRIDGIFACNGVIYVIEFKVGESRYPKHAIDQVVDYALDLKYFHKESHTRKIVPILVCTDAPDFENALNVSDDQVYEPVLCNRNTFKHVLKKTTNEISGTQMNFTDWLESQYTPTPTIIEAAQALYRGHDVKEISRSDSESYNLSLTTDAINRIIDHTKASHKKSICFVTGVPGAGKTLAGLNMATARHNFGENEHAVFLSGNGPLVFVLTEALARDKYERSGHAVRKGKAKREAETIIQNIHHFRDEALKSTLAPIEKVTIFDEAQRAWTLEQTAKFMAEKGHFPWTMSEPEFLISYMDRHNDWAVVICLVGGGQEINTGEAGLPAWFDALRNHFKDWQVYLSEHLTDDEYTRGRSLPEMLHGLHITKLPELHLAVSLRSFRSEQVSAFVKALLDTDLPKARVLYSEIEPRYPIVMTRDLDTARNWVRSKARGTERYGMTASSGAKRLRIFGIWVQSDITPENWFLNGKDDVRSCYYLEDTATEFDIQGLEIDWTIVSWDADYRIQDERFVAYSFVGTDWNIIQKEDDKRYLKNAYRVLLTRARQGMVIFLPDGDDDDRTRKRKYYDATYEYLRSIGIKEI